MTDIDEAFLAERERIVAKLKRGDSECVEFPADMGRPLGDQRGQWIIHERYSDFMADAEAAVPALIAEVRRLRADHAEMVARNKLLRDRPDLPIERLRAYDSLMAEFQRLRDLRP